MIAFMCQARDTDALRLNPQERAMNWMIKIGHKSGQTQLLENVNPFSTRKAAREFIKTRMTGSKNTYWINSICPVKVSVKYTEIT